MTEAESRAHVRGEIVEPKDKDFWLEEGYVLEKIVGGLTYASNACVTPDGELYVLEAGFSYPFIYTTARLSRVTPEGETELITEDLNRPAIGLVWHDDGFLVTHRGVLSHVSRKGERHDLVTDVPAAGDHHTNHIAVRDGVVYFGQGSPTNSGVVGADNLVAFGWLATHREFCDIPAHDITLSGLNYETRDVFNPLKEATTGAYMPFGTPSSEGQVVRGQTRATGVIYRCNPDGSDLAVHAWGLRNPYSVAFAPDGRLFCLDQGADDRGARPFHSLDTIWEVKEDAWFGFPDFLGGRPADEIADELEYDGPRGFLLAQHPPREMPFALVPELHAAAVQMQFAEGDAFGFAGHAFIAQYGSGAPFTTHGKMEKSQQGVRRFDPVSREFHDFYRNDNPNFGGSGPERPTAVRFSPDGAELYIADYGITGLPKTGALWRIRRG